MARNVVGVPFTSPTRYVGPGTNLIPIKKVGREPLGTDNSYPLGQFWLIDKDPTTGNVGDIWYLSDFNAGLAVWVIFGGGAGDVITLSDNAGTKSDPDMTGDIKVVGIQETSTISSLNTISILSPRTHAFVVDPIADVGTHQTVTAAVTAASSGDTVFVRPGVYIEDPVMKDGVLVKADPGTGLSGEAEIIGKLSASTAGTFVVEGIRLTTNGDFFLEVTGAAASVVQLFECYLNITDNTGINFTSSSASSRIFLERCNGDISALGITLYDHTSSGAIQIDYCRVTNSAQSTTPSNCSVSNFQIRFSQLSFPFSTTGTGEFNVWKSVFDIGTSVTVFECSGTRGSIIHSWLSSNAATPLVIPSAEISVFDTILRTTNNVIASGAGSIEYSNLSSTIPTSESNITVTTQVPVITQMGIYRAHGQPAFNAVQETKDNDILGSPAPTYFLGDTDIGTTLTEQFDQGGDFVPGASGGAVFTAPITGKYHFEHFVLLQDLNGTAHSPSLSLVTSNKSYTFGDYAVPVAGNFPMLFSVLQDMDSGDTAQFGVTVSGAGTTVDLFGDASIPRTGVSGYLTC